MARWMLMKVHLFRNSSPVSISNTIASRLTSRISLDNAAFRHSASLTEPKYPSKRPDAEFLKRDNVDYANLSSIAMNLYTTGIEEVSSATMIRNALHYNKDHGFLELYCNDFVLQRFQPHEGMSPRAMHSRFPVKKNIHVVAFGKAVTGMARAVEDIFGDHIVRGIAVIPKGYQYGLKAANRAHMLPKEDTKFEIIEGGTACLPDEKAVYAAELISHHVKSLTSDDILITLLSGGGSCLVCLPKPPVTMEDKVEVNKLLNRAGATTLELNTVRKNLSLIKAGGLAEMANPAKVISLILSNLPHSKSTEVASGPTTPDFSTPHQALEIFRKYNIHDLVPERVMTLLQEEARDAISMKWFSENEKLVDIYSGPKPRYNVANAINVLAGSDDIAAGAILKLCAGYEIPACAIQNTSATNTHAYGKLFAAVAQYVSSILTRNRYSADPALVQCELDCIAAGMNKKDLKMIAKSAEEACSMRRPVCLIFTSEITTEVKGSGLGGPCQEVALATAIQLKKRYDKYECLRKCDVELFSIDSDGMDGSTSVAGAIANCHQAAELVEGKTAYSYLRNNDSYNFYSKLEGGKYQVHTGMTGTDIQNFQLLLIRNKAI